jgi:predicted Zn-dependent protease with MMP-like domain
MTGMEKRREKLARDEVEAIITSLPAPLLGPAKKVPVIFESLPDPDDNQDADLLGLFIGAELACEGDEPLPQQIILFLENLWDEAGCDERAFREEVRITYLHELGHYLGLDEDDLFERGLE